MMSIYNLHRTLAVSEDQEQAQTRILSVVIKEMIKRKLCQVKDLRNSIGILEPVMGDSSDQGSY